VAGLSKKALTNESTTTVVVYNNEELKVESGMRDIHGAVTEIPSVIPAYASSCDDAAEYASACSCWAITAWTSTAPTPTVTVTISADSCEEL
jgi:hypothetical protein